jgi:hypothetical protein
MAFTVEDGTGVEDANSYASFADWTAYWDDRGTAPSTVEADVEKALVRGADYMSIRYRFRGRKLTEEQGLDWPRCGARDADGVYLEGVPEVVVRANIELAARALEGDLAPDPTTDASGQTVVSSRVKVGPIERESTFNGGGSATWVKPYPAVDRMLRDVTYPEGGRVWRA